MMRLDCAIYENLFAIVLGIVFAMDWLARYFQRCVSRPSSIRFRAGDSSLLSFRIKIQKQGDRDLYSKLCIFGQSKSWQKRFALSTLFFRKQFPALILIRPYFHI